VLAGRKAPFDNATRRRRGRRTQKETSCRRQEGSQAQRQKVGKRSRLGQKGHSVQKVRRGRGSSSGRRCCSPPVVLILSSLLPLSAIAATDKVPSVTANTRVSGTATVISGVTCEVNDQTPRHGPYQWTFPNGKVTLPTVTRIGPTLQLVSPPPASLLLRQCSLDVLSLQTFPPTRCTLCKHVGP
jgi:hypothetical protein